MHKRAEECLACVCKVLRRQCNAASTARGEEGESIVQARWKRKATKGFGEGSKGGVRVRGCLTGERRGLRWLGENLSTPRCVVAAKVSSWLGSKCSCRQLPYAERHKGKRISAVPHIYVSCLASVSTCLPLAWYTYVLLSPSGGEQVWRQCSQ